MCNPCSGRLKTAYRQSWWVRVYGTIQESPLIRIGHRRLRGIVLFLFCLVPYASADADEDVFAIQTMRIGFYALSFPEFSVRDVEISIKLLSEEIGKEVGIPTSVEVYEDVQAMRRDFEAGTINFVVASTMLLATKFDVASFAAGFRFISDVSSSERMLVLGLLQPGKESFADYFGQRLILAQSEPSADLYIDYLSRLHFKQNYTTSFKLVGREKKAHQLVLKVFFAQAELTCVYQSVYDTAVEMNPQLKDRIVTLAQFDHLPQSVGFFHSKTPPDFVEKVLQETDKLHKRPRGQVLLQLFNSEQAIRTNWRDLRGAIELHAAYDRLMRRK
jgi:hypothetical protein